MAINLPKLLEDAITQKASDVHISIKQPPIIRSHRALMQLSGYQPLTGEDIQFILGQLMNQDQKDMFEVNKEVDFSFSLGGIARFRVNAFHQKGYPAVALRVIPNTIPSLEDLMLPPIVHNFAKLNQGLMLVTGPTGSGKSTTIASLIDRINDTRAEHIVTIEDPIEYIFSDKMSLIQQREMHLDTHSWEQSLRSVLRQDPDIVLVGEMRDLETIEAAINLAETGHLVFATLHTNSASETMDRIISSYSSEKQRQIQVQLAAIIEVVLSQRLVPSDKHGVVPAVEIMIATDAIKNLIREGKAFHIDNAIRTGMSLGMQTLDRSLIELIKEETITYEEAMKITSNPEELTRLIKAEGAARA
jgi:twitching motility protein PilT